jgi:uncharacterized integral membrane protein (TIGR00697 family)
MLEFTLSKRNKLFIILCGFFITNALIAEMIGIKIFSLEDTLHLVKNPIHIFNQSLTFNLTAGVVIWPFVFITTDIINEYFGKKGVLFASYLGTAFITYSFICIYTATKLSPSQEWIQFNQSSFNGSSTNINDAFRLIYSQGLGIIIGSISAFFIGQLIDMFIFQWIRKKTQQKHLWLRATGSTLISQFIDSYVVLFIAFYLLAGNNKWTIEFILAVGTMNYLYKLIVAILLTPIIYLGHYIIDRYLKNE